jgi:hypothetical protein
MAVKTDTKYYNLYMHLRRSAEDQVALTFDELEHLIGDQLPSSARKGRAFWSNRKSGATQASAWMEAGYHVIEVDLVDQCVTFGRPIVQYTVRREGDTVLWDGVMVRALRAHLAVNQSELAGLLGVRQQTVSEWETAAYAPTRARSKHLTMVAERVGFPFNTGRVKDQGKP